MQDIIDTIAVTNSASTTSKRLSVGSFCRGSFVAPTSVTAVSFYSALTESDTPTPIHYSGTNTAISVTVTAGKTYPIPADCFSVSYLVIVITGTASATMSFTMSDAPNASSMSIAVTADSELPAAAALANNTSNPTTPLIGSCLMVFDGTTWDRAPGDSASGTKVQPAIAGPGTADPLAFRVVTATDSPDVTALEIMDDWDESDRCKVNIISGQVGVAANAGAASATTQRTVTATDSPDVTSLQIMDDWDDTDRAKVSGLVARVAAAQMTRPADTTAYASGDLVANNTTAGSVTPLSFTAGRGSSGGAASGMIRRVKVKKSTASVTNSSFRVHFYSSSPTVTNGDNGAWLSIESGYLGSCDVTVDKAFSDAASGTGSPLIGSEITFSAQTVYALIEARAAYTPGNAETFDVTIEVLQN